MNIVLTGVTGFLGSHLAHELLRRHHQIIVLKRKDSNTNRLYDIINHIQLFDIDSNFMETVFQNQHIDAVIHTACCYRRKSIFFAK